MDVMVECAAGLDVHQKSVSVTVIIGRAGHRPRRERRSFGTMKRDLEALATWLAEQGVTDVAMESTGVYWMPVYEALEGRFVLVVANAHHVKNVPGRKTDTRDADWLAELLRHGLIKASFVPNEAQRLLRVLTRERRVLVESHSRERNLMIKLLESANIKLAGVLSDVFGVSGRAMLRGLIDGVVATGKLANLARGKARHKLSSLEAALEGRLRAEHRLVLRLHLETLETIERQIGSFDTLIAERLTPHAEIVKRLVQIPGVDMVVASVILAEIGPDVASFADAHRLAAWAGLCPGNNRSAGRVKSSRIRKGNVHLKTTLVQAAMAASKRKGSYLKAKYHLLKARLGPKAAAVAIAHKMVIAVYAMLATGACYKDLGEAYLDRQRDPAKAARQWVKRLQSIGYEVTLRPIPQPVPV